VNTANDIAGVGEPSIGQPWNLVGDINASANKQFSWATGDGNYWFNPAAFAAPAPGTFGNATRNLIYGLGQQQWDLALFKNFRTGGPTSIQFRAEVFNLFNHPNLCNPAIDPNNQDDVRPRHRQGRLAARHPVEPALPILRRAFHHTSASETPFQF
jgi:hypothetical protein